MDPAPPEPSPDLVPPRPVSDHRAARGIARSLLTGCAVLVVGVIVGVGAGFALRNDPATTVEARQTKAPSTGTATAQHAKKTKVVRALTIAAPMKLWIGGDSLAGSLGPSLGQMTAATGVVAPTFDSRVSTGLTSPEFFDWPKHATQEMARLQPEAVVYIIDTNDANTMPDLTTATGDWKAQYQAKVEQMMKIFIGATHRPVYWVGAPPMKSRQLNSNVEVLNSVIAEVAARHPEVTFLDVSSLFTDSQGRWESSTTDPTTGKTVTLRARDGIHLTPEGGDRMATPVFDAIDADWHLRRQAVLGHVQPVLETPGSSQVPGTGRSLNSSSGSSSRNPSGSGTTTTTRAPVLQTAPPQTTVTTQVTSPPTTTPASTVPATSGSTPPG